MVQPNSTISGGQTYLRGYQVSGAKGQVTFKTIYPGFYSGRTVHIHVRVRTFDANNNATTNGCNACAAACHPTIRLTNEP